MIFEQLDLKNTDSSLISFSFNALFNEFIDIGVTRDIYKKHSQR